MILDQCLNISVNHQIDKNKISRAIYKGVKSDDHERLNKNAQNFTMQYILAIKYHEQL